MFVPLLLWTCNSPSQISSSSTKNLSNFLSICVHGPLVIHTPYWKYFRQRAAAASYQAGIQSHKAGSKSGNQHLPFPRGSNCEVIKSLQLTPQQPESASPAWWRKIFTFHLPSFATYTSEFKTVSLQDLKEKKLWVKIHQKTPSSSHLSWLGHVPHTHPERHDPNPKSSPPASSFATYY